MAIKPDCSNYCIFKPSTNNGYALLYRLLMILFHHTCSLVKRYSACVCLMTMILLFGSEYLIAQTDSLHQPNDSTVIDVAKVRFQKILYKEVQIAVSSDRVMKNESIYSLPFKPAP